MNRKFFVAKSGKTTGPYSEKEFETLKSSAEFSNYTWYWDSEKPGWQAIDPPPAAPYEIAEPVVARAMQPQVQTAPYDQPPAAKVLAYSSTVEAVCHDQHKVVSGTIFRITDYGCDLVSRHMSPDRCFALQSKVYLNLLDSKSGKSIDIAAQLAGVTRKNGKWTYRLRWNECPDIVKQTAVAA